jgi:hypothetical protein
VTDDVTPTPALDREPSHPAAAAPTPGARPRSADVAARRPAYRGEESDAARGPGVGCFWFQAVVLAFFLVLILIGITLNWSFEVLAGLLSVVLGLLLIVGQTLIFLLRLVAADRREAGRRRPPAGATPTVGELEDGQLRRAWAIAPLRRCTRATPGSSAASVAFEHSTWSRRRGRRC